MKIYTILNFKSKEKNCFFQDTEIINYAIYMQMIISNHLETKKVVLDDIGKQDNEFLDLTRNG